jgi:hypothetical protein
VYSADSPHPLAAYTVPPFSRTATCASGQPRSRAKRSLIRPEVDAQPAGAGARTSQKSQKK